MKAALRGFAPYTPGLQPADEEGWVKLNTNESPWPPSPKVLEAVRELRPEAPLTAWDDLGHYPQIEDPSRVATVIAAAIKASRA